LVGEQYAQRSCYEEKPKNPDCVVADRVPKDWGVEENVLVVCCSRPLDVLKSDTCPIGKRETDGGDGWKPDERDVKKSRDSDEEPEGYFVLPCKEAAASSNLFCARRRRLY